MWKVDFTISYSTQKLLSKLPKIIDDYMRRYAASAEKGSKEAIDKGILINSIDPKTGGGKLKGLADTTIRMRKEAGITGTKPLYETGTFENAMVASEVPPMKWPFVKSKDALVLSDSSFGYQMKNALTSHSSSLLIIPVQIGRPILHRRT